MTRFIDGPAKGKTLMLKRAPMMLRVVVDHRGEVDALDMLDDFPRPDEQCHAYVLTGPPMMAFINGTKCRGRYPVAEYRLVQPQPDQLVMRDEQEWARWANAEGPKVEWFRQRGGAV